MNLNNQVEELFEIKSAMAPGLCEAVREIMAHGDKEHMLNDIIKLARMLDLATPSTKFTPASITDPRYNLLNFIIRNSSSRTLNEINPDEILFNEKKPFTCIGQVQEIFLDVADKIAKVFVHEEINA